MPRPPISLKARALKYLSSREHSRLELARKLTPYAQEGDDIDALLNWLEQSRFLSQERFSESLVNRRAARYGNNRILSELHGHGIEGEGLADLKADLAAGEGARAAQVLRRKFAEPAGDAETRAKQMRFLQQRGFSHGSIRHALKQAWSDEEGDG
ncbi:recombination regulator RecX [Herbaspirillum sp. WKF16]|jgi:regulatory protein|uniref:recombination regulator RecX n=1 Tax=Herbaspirillum sp. WKF16 TaxID=3028312 RepID=UPI0023A97E22|nr:recombination regulator RecX [Herbaspirillum sp. WKF16]WDZ96841.1 recombination regulator RecX [Herbaspirillum sp. WKF16]